MSDATLLPPSSSALERALDLAAAERLAALTAGVPDLWSIERCPEPLLGHLAWSLSVDDWSDDWSENVKRAVIRASIPVHRRKGTPGSVQDAIGAVAGSADVSEWWEYEGPRHTFRVAVPPFDAPGRLGEIVRAIRRTKPAHAHLDLLTMRRQIDGRVTVGGVVRHVRQAKLRHDPLPKVPAGTLRVGAVMSGVRTMYLRPFRRPPAVPGGMALVGAVLRMVRTTMLQPATFSTRQGLVAVIAERLKSLAVSFVAQTEESDQAFLTRLGKRYGAVIAPKNGRFIVTERRTGKTASGQTLATINVSASRLRSEGAYHVRLKPRSRFSEVVARWQDRTPGTVRKEVVKGADKGPSMTLREVFQTAPEARQAAQARAKELRAGEGELSLELIGDPYARAESPIIVAGVSLDADGSWIASTVTHVWNYGESGGAVTIVEAEFGTDDEDEKDDEPKRTRRTARTPSNSSRPDGDYVSILDR